MTETSVSTPWMEKLRVALGPYYEVIKHHDVSTYAVLDCSITGNDHVWWVEFKLWKPPAKWSKHFNLGHGCEIPYEKIAAESHVQFAAAKRLAKAGRCWYIFWVNRTKRVDLWHPLTGYTVKTDSTDFMVKTFLEYMQVKDPTASISK